MVFRVDSEVGPLHQVVLHRPGLELARLTRDNVDEMLFSGVPSADRAVEEHDAFATSLRDHGVQVHYFSRLLAETLDVAEGRAFVLDRVCTPEIVGPALVDPLRSWLDGLESPTLTGHLVGGIVKTDLQPRPARHSLRWDTLAGDDFLLPPLPNHLFQRDSSSWIYGGVCISPMAMPPRHREWLHTRAVYRYHPMFAGGPLTVFYGEDDAPRQAATVEGGDVHVVGNGCVLVGLGERTSAMAVEMLARALFDSGQVRTVIAIELPTSPPAMHLDTVMTMVDRATFVAHARLRDGVRSWTLTPSGEEAGALGVSPNPSLSDAIGSALGEDPTLLWTEGGTNYLAVAPGVVYGYLDNVETNRLLTGHGIEVIPVAGRELGRGRGGPRCMSCPIERGAA